MIFYHVRTHQPYMPGQGNRATYADMIYRDRDDAETYLAAARKLEQVRNDGTWSHVIEVHPVVWQHARNGYVIDGDPYAADDADTMTAFFEDGTVACHVARTSRGNWRIETSDYASYSTTMARKRFRSASDALHAGIAGTGRFTTRVSDFLDYTRI